MLWSLSHGASSMPAFANGSHYAIHVLAADQKALAERFATRGIDRWAGVEHRPGINGAPLLAGAAATFECFNRSQYKRATTPSLWARWNAANTAKVLRPCCTTGGKFYTDTAVGHAPLLPCY